MKSPSEPAFTVVDRRGQPREAEAPMAVEVLAKPGKAWEEVIYTRQIAMNAPQSYIMLGRVVGLRDDGKTFRADYLLLPIVVDHNFDWRPEAKKRLDTFLGCECSIAHGPCAVHKLMLPKWQQADEQRFGLMASRPVPRALEAMYMEEAARAKSSIVVPR